MAVLNDGKPLTCDGKHPFESKALASQVARRSARSKGTAPEAYKCLICHQWHVGRVLRDNRATKLRTVRKHA